MSACAIPTDILWDWTVMQSAHMSAVNVLHLSVEYPGNDADTWWIPEWALPLLVDAVVRSHYGPSSLRPVSAPMAGDKWTRATQYYNLPEVDPGRLILEDWPMPVELGGELGPITDEDTGDVVYGLTLDVTFADGSTDVWAIPQTLLSLVADAVSGVTYWAGGQS